MRNSKDKLMLIISMIIFGTIGIFRKLIPLSSSLLASFRGITGAFFIFLFLLLKNKKIKTPNRKTLILLLISGTLIGINWILLFESYNYTSVAIATICYYTQPIMLVILSPFIFKEKITIKKLIAIVLAMMGMILISGINFKESSFKGILFGLSAALIYALVVIMNKYIKDISSYEKTAYQLLSAGLTIIPYFLLNKETFNFSLDLTSVLMLLTVGIIHTGIAYVLYFGSISKLNIQTVAIISYLDPLTAILLSVLFLMEAISILEIIGIVLILGATLISD